MVSVREIGCTASLDKLSISGYSMLVSIHTHMEKESMGAHKREPYRARPS